MSISNFWHGTNHYHLVRLYDDSYERYLQNINVECIKTFELNWHKYGLNGSGENKEKWTQTNIVREQLRKKRHTYVYN